MSNAIGSEIVTKALGYTIFGANFNNNTPNLPMRIAILAEGNQANQGTMPTSETNVTSLAQAGDSFGYGSMIYKIFQILRPSNGDGVGGIPTYVYPQLAVGGSAAKEMEIQVVAPSDATDNTTHTLVIAGRRIENGQSYNFNIETGDSPDDIADKIEEVILSVLACPFDGAASGLGVVSLTSKWQGLTAEDLTITVDSNGNNAGVTYNISTTTNASGTPDIAPALAEMSGKWNTIVINSYGKVETVVSALEAFNGVPSETNPTGQYSGTIFQPFVALTGFTTDNENAFTDARKGQVTLAMCPAPYSPALPVEAAANTARILARKTQDSPHLDASGEKYPDMPVGTASDGTLGSTRDLAGRQNSVIQGCSTVVLSDGQYEINDLITTYHPTGEINPTFRFVRSLMIDFNMAFRVKLKQEQFVVDHVIAPDNSVIQADKVVKPKTWKAVLFDLADQAERDGLIVDQAFFRQELTVEIGTSNPARLDTNIKYKRSEMARQVATTAQIGFFTES